MNNSSIIHSNIATIGVVKIAFYLLKYSNNNQEMHTTNIIPKRTFIQINNKLIK